MSYWTKVNGNIVVEPMGDTQAEIRYVLDSVLEHLPIVSGSEGCMDVYIIGIEHAKISNLSWDQMKVKEYTVVHTRASVGNSCFFKVDVRLKEGRKLVFDKRSEFRAFCEENGIYYDFKNGLMFKDNKLFGVFSDIGKAMQNNYLNMLNL